MSLTVTKKILIALGVVGFLVVIGVGAFVYWLIWMPEKPSPQDQAMMAEGREFAKTTDQRGCMTEGVKRSRQISFIDIKGNVSNDYFVDECLKRARQTPGFCEGVPGYWDVSRTSWPDEQCEKQGIKRSEIACSAVYEDQVKFCAGY